MNTFQYLTLPVLCLLMAQELWGVTAGPNSRKGHLSRLAIWMTAFLAIAIPNSTSWLARWMGIGRGTDLVIYCFMLATLASLFHVYSRCFALQQQLVELARRDALENAVRGASTNVQP